MEITRDDRIRMERAHVRAWPARQTDNVHGWLWRSSGGGSQRANSVSTIDFHSPDPEATIIEVEARYRAVGAPAQFQTFDETSPAVVPDLLRRRGYRQGDPTVTMFKRISGIDTAPAVRAQDHAWRAWKAAYLAEITESRRATNALILDQIPAVRRFFGGYRDGCLTSTALCVIGFNCAVVECVTTRRDGRRQGVAREVLIALEHWAAQQEADWLGLQVVATNTPAVRLYEHLGFMPGAMNRFWVSNHVTEGEHRRLLQDQA